MSAKLENSINDASERLEYAREAYREADTDLSLEEAENQLRPFGLRSPKTDVERELADAKLELKRLRSLL